MAFVHILFLELVTILFSPQVSFVIPDKHIKPCYSLGEWLLHSKQQENKKKQKKSRWLAILLMAKPWRFPHALESPRLPAEGPCQMWPSSGVQLLPNPLKPQPFGVVGPSATRDATLLTQRKIIFFSITK